MALLVYTLEQSEQWDALVRSFRDYDVYYLSGYVRAFEIHGDGQPLLFSYEDENTRGINVVMKRDITRDKNFVGKIPKKRYFDFATPYGYGGWIIEGTETKALFEAYEKWIDRNGIISEFVRFHPMIKNHEACRPFYDVVQLGEVVHMDLSSPEIIWENLHSSKRKQVRKAIKDGIKVFNGRFPGIIDPFRKLYNETMNRDHAEPYYYFEEEFYRSILEHLPYNAHVFWAEKDGQIIAATIMVEANGRMNTLFSGIGTEFLPLNSGTILRYEIARWGCANGYKTLHLGGGVGSQEDSLFRFKRSFYKGELNRFHIGKKIYDREKYDELLSLRTDIQNTGFFPQYRG